MEAAAAVFPDRGAKALQYSSTPGEPELREQAARRVSRTLPTTADQIQITTGSQEAIYLVGHAMLRPGDVVLVERPTYLAAVQAFASSGARMIGIPSDDDGAEPEALVEVAPGPHLLLAGERGEGGTLVLGEGQVVEGREARVVEVLDDSTCPTFSRTVVRSGAAAFVAASFSLISWSTPFRSW